MATYTVKSGDSMWAIANAHSLSLDALIAANPQVADPSQIQVGQILNLSPAAGPGSWAPSAANSVSPVPSSSAQPVNHPPVQQAPAPAPTAQLPPSVVPGHGGEGFKTVGYFTNWGIYGRNYQPFDIPGNHITHILYSFANVRPNTGEVYLSDTYADLEKHYPSDRWDEPGENVYGCIKQLFLLKKHYRHLKTLLSVGGWTYSTNFPSPASTPSGRQTFARSAVQLLADLGFDGIDIDWEYPQDAGQARDFVLLLEETRRALDGYSARYLSGKRLLLTIAAPCGQNNYSKLRMAEMDRYLDFWNLMCYDFAGSWDSKAGHMANVFPSHKTPVSTPFNADSAVGAYIAGGVHPKKIIFGLPLYGRAFEGTKGPGHSFKGVGEGSWENGVWDYKALPQSGGEEHDDENIIAGWSYASKGKKMISYDTPTTARRKVEYIRGKGLGGGMWWELSGDHPVGHERSLVKTTVDGFGGSRNLDLSENTLDYPISRYENLKGKFATG